jgi:hypothetical protein
MYGAVYRAERVGQEQDGPGALKVALLPGDPRFAREAELLRRVSHPSIPRLRDSGAWQLPSGTVYPYIVMDWVGGVPLYDWARLHNPDSQQVLRVMAQLARALAALQAQGLVHRDVKGDNVLVRISDGRAFLTDFGVGLHPGAETLTPPAWFPGTPAYRAPESRLFELQCSRDATARYRAGPADDLYALGITAYRLLTGEYPELGEPRQDEEGRWRLEDVAPPAPLVLNPRVDPRLSALCLRMLSVRPEARGTAEELAEAMEQAVEHPVPQSAQRLFPVEPEPGAKVQVAEESARGVRGAGGVSPPVSVRQWSSRLLASAAVFMLVTWAWWMAPESSGEKSSVAQPETGGAGQQDGGTAGLGEAAASVAAVDSAGPSFQEGVAEDPLPEPLPGQARPDANGRCPRKQQVVLNGGCWKRLSLEREECEEISGHVFKDACYVPGSPPRRKPTSSPIRDQ